MRNEIKKAVERGMLECNYHKSENDINTITEHILKVIYGKINAAIINAAIMLVIIVIFTILKR